MKLELKNIKVFESLSEETTAFTASLYIDDVLVGGCKNQGHGGATSYYPHNDDCRKTIKDAEKYFSSLPPVKSEYGDLPMDLESAIDNFLYAHLLESDKKKFAKKLEKDMQKGICVGVNGANEYGFYKLQKPIAEILKYPNGREYIDKVIGNIKSKLKDGEQILNTNLPAL